MNYIKNKFQNHEIKPSKMAWERIESELDKDKIRVLPLNIRWAAAAVFLVGATGVLIYSVSQNADNQVVVNNKASRVEPISVPNITIPTVLKDEKNVIVNVKKEVAKTKLVTPIYRKEMPTVVKDFVQIPQLYTPIFQTEIPKKAARLPLENANTIAKIDWKYLDVKTKNIDIQRAKEEDDEDTDEAVTLNNLRFPQILNRVEGDSTLTEKIITFGQMKAKQAVAKAFRPVLKRFQR